MQGVIKKKQNHSCQSDVKSQQKVALQEPLLENTTKENTYSKGILTL